MMSGFGKVLQELTRTLRQNDGPANSFLAGGLAAYALSIIQCELLLFLAITESTMFS